MSKLFPRLLGDVGGTSARWAWQAAPGAGFAPTGTYRCEAFASIEACARRFLADHALPAPQAMAVGVATPVTGDAVRMTNHPWSFSVTGLGAALGAAQCRVVNDFEALARALPALGESDLLRIGCAPVPPAQAMAAWPRAVLGPGTGLGVAGLLPGIDGGAPVPIAGEGGHATLAAGDARESEVLAVLRERFGHASAERALSGPGLVALYEAVCSLERCPPLALQPADVTTRALTRSDAACVEALRLFASFLGNVAGNVALTFGARGGVYIGGGIVPRLAPVLPALPFRERFEAKGRFARYLEAIPTWVITAPAPALVGAACALDAA